MLSMTRLKGCDKHNAAGCAGRYRTWANDDLLGLPTCLWRQHAFFNLGDKADQLFDIELPDSFNVTCLSRDWCGRAYRYSFDDEYVDAQLRTSLPGPMFSSSSTVLRLRSYTGCDWRDFHDLETGQIIDSHGSEQIEGGRLFYVTSDKTPVLIVCSEPMQALGNITHRHYQFHFANNNVNVLVVPLLTEQDVPRSKEQQALWLQLIAAPPTEISESYEFDGDVLRITAESNSDCIALSPMLSMLGERDGLVQNLTAAQPILHTWNGPYAIINASSYSYDIDAKWMFAKTAAGNGADGDFSEVPEELAYAGDATWEPGTVMDQFLSLRSWAPYLHNAPQAVQDELLPLLKLPTEQEFIDAVEIITDDTARGSWGRWRSMWAHNGDACYDIDWYNGLGLSGLARAVHSPIAEISEPAKKLSAACKEQRAGLFDYFVVFMDWNHHTPMTDPQGWMWNADCLHNGLEGIIAEAQLRAEEGDAEGAAFAYYIAARTGVGLRAAMEFPRYHQELDQHKFNNASDFKSNRMVTWSKTEGVHDRPDSPAIGVQGVGGFQGKFTWCTGATRNPYVLSGHNPYWSAILKAHWSGKDALLADWDANEPERQRDWIAYYIGTDWEERRKRGDQEARIQAAVFYSLAPEICFRYWCMGADAAALESSFASPLHLNEQIMLRAGCQLDAGVVDWPLKG